MAKLLIVKGTYYSAGSYPPRSDFAYLQKILSNSLLQEKFDRVWSKAEIIAAMSLRRN